MSLTFFCCRSLTEAQWNTLIVLNMRSFQKNQAYVAIKVYLEYTESPYRIKV